MQTRFRVGGLAVAVWLAALITVPVASAATVAPLTGETLITSEAGDPGTSELSGTCDPLGTSTFTFLVTGVAVGPYAGTFVEEGTFTAGPALSGFLVQSFESTFTITSATGTVTGGKTLTGATSVGTAPCGAFAFGGTEANAVDLQTGLRYTAQITTPAGTAADSGDSFLNYDESQLRGPAAQGNGFSFTETFTSTAPVPCEEDNDDQGDDECGDDDQGEDEG